MHSQQSRIPLDDAQYLLQMLGIVTDENDEWNKIQAASDITVSSASLCYDGAAGYKE